MPTVANSAKLAGTGSKSGTSFILEGDYVFRDSVKAKAGCHFTVYPIGLDTEPIDDYQTNSAGSYSNSTDETGLEDGAYSFKVTATRCGSWSVSLGRP